MIAYNSCFGCNVEHDYDPSFLTTLFQGLVLFLFLSSVLNHCLLLLVDTSDMEGPTAYKAT
jgi:hypothetical protein